MQNRSQDEVTKLLISFRYKDAVQASRCNRKIEQLYQHKLFPAIAQVFDGLGLADFHIELEDLEIDLGQIYEYELEDGLQKKISEALLGAIEKQLLQQQKASGESMFPGNLLHKLYLSALESYLTKGYFPEWLDPNIGLVAIIERIVQDLPQLLNQLLRKISAGNEDVRKRIAFLPDPYFFKVLKVLVPEDAAWMIDYRDSLLQYKKEEISIQGSEENMKKAINLFLVEYVMQNSGPRLNKFNFSKRLLKSVADHYNIKFEDFVARLDNAISDIKNQSSYFKEFRETIHWVKAQSLPESATLIHEEYMESFINWLNGRQSLHTIPPYFLDLLKENQVSLQDFPKFPQLGEALTYLGSQRLLILLARENPMLWAQTDQDFALPDKDLLQKAIKGQQENLQLLFKASVRLGFPIDFIFFYIGYSQKMESSKRGFKPSYQFAAEKSLQVFREKFGTSTISVNASTPFQQDLKVMLDEIPSHGYSLVEVSPKAEDYQRLIQWLVTKRSERGMPSFFHFLVSKEAFLKELHSFVPNFWESLSLDALIRLISWNAGNNTVAQQEVYSFYSGMFERSSSVSIEKNHQFLKQAISLAIQSPQPLEVLFVILAYTNKHNSVGQNLYLETTEIALRNEDRQELDTANTEQSLLDLARISRRDLSQSSGDMGQVYEESVEESHVIRLINWLESNAAITSTPYFVNTWLEQRKVMNHVIVFAPDFYSKMSTGGLFRLLLLFTWKQEAYLSKIYHYFFESATATLATIRKGFGSLVKEFQVGIDSDEFVVENFERFFLDLSGNTAQKAIQTLERLSPQTYRERLSVYEGNAHLVEDFLSITDTLLSPSANEESLSMVGILSIDSIQEMIAQLNGSKHLNSILPAVELMIQKDAFWVFVRLQFPDFWAKLTQSGIHRFLLLLGRGNERKLHAIASFYEEIYTAEPSQQLLAKEKQLRKVLQIASEKQFPQEYLWSYLKFQQIQSTALMQALAGVAAEPKATSIAAPKIGGELMPPSSEDQELMEDFNATAEWLLSQRAQTKSQEAFLRIKLGKQLINWLNGPAGLTELPETLETWLHSGNLLENLAKVIPGFWESVTKRGIRKIFGLLAGAQVEQWITLTSHYLIWLKKVKPENALDHESLVRLILASLNPIQSQRLQSSEKLELWYRVLSEYTRTTVVSDISEMHAWLDFQLSLSHNFAGLLVPVVAIKKQGGVGIPPVVTSIEEEGGASVSDSFTLQSASLNELAVAQVSTFLSGRITENWVGEEDITDFIQAIHQLRDLPLDRWLEIGQFTTSRKFRFPKELREAFSFVSLDRVLSLVKTVVGERNLTNEQWAIFEQVLPSGNSNTPWAIVQLIMLSTPMGDRQPTKSNSLKLVKKILRLMAKDTSVTYALEVLLEQISEKELASAKVSRQRLARLIIQDIRWIGERLQWETLHDLLIHDLKLRYKRLHTVLKEDPELLIRVAIQQLEDMKPFLLVLQYYLKRQEWEEWVAFMKFHLNKQTNAQGGKTDELFRYLQNISRPSNALSKQLLRVMVPKKGGPTEGVLKMLDADLSKLAKSIDFDALYSLSDEFFLNTLAKKRWKVALSNALMTFNFLFQVDNRLVRKDFLKIVHKNLLKVAYDIGPDRLNWMLLLGVYDHTVNDLDPLLRTFLRSFYERAYLGKVQPSRYDGYFAGLTFINKQGYVPWWSIHRKKSTMLIGFFNVIEGLKSEDIRSIAPLVEKGNHKRLLKGLKLQELIALVRIIRSSKFRSEFREFAVAVDAVIAHFQALDQGAKKIVETNTQKESNEFQLAKLKPSFQERWISRQVHHGKSALLIHEWFGQHRGLVKLLVLLISWGPWMYGRNINPNRWKTWVLVYARIYFQAKEPANEKDFFTWFLTRLVKERADVKWKIIFHQMLQRNRALTNEIKQEIYSIFPLKQQEALKAPEKGDAIRVANAGLILCWPFLSALFSRLKILEKGAIRSSEKSRAVYLLQYLVFGEYDYPEYEMVLNKLMVGMPVGEHLEKIELSTEEKEMTESLLYGLKSNWEKMKNASIDAIRETFLQREGKLIIGDSSNKLTVPKTGVDILLESLSWNIAIVKLPWMEKSLEIKWK